MTAGETLLHMELDLSVIKLMTETLAQNRSSRVENGEIGISFLRCVPVVDKK